MFNLFALILTIFTCFSGVCWMIRYFKKGHLFCSFFQCKLEKFFLVCNFFKYFTDKKVFIFIRKVCYHFLIWFVDICVSVFPILCFIFLMRSFVFEPFQIPSGSMMPTLLSGDFILVNKFCYGIKNPVTQGTLINVGHPKRGDLVVFKYPLDTKLDYIKRVVGVPGDRVVYNALSKRLIIYPNCDLSSSEHVISLFPIIYTNISPSNFIQVFKIQNGEVISDFHTISSDKKIVNGVRLIQSEESFNGVKHNILTMTDPSSYDFSKVYNQEKLSEFVSEWVVPIGEYFMLGDNRDNSSDSRYWGFVPEKNIVGKAIIIWMSIDKNQDQSWPINFRLNRIGKIY